MGMSVLFSPIVRRQWEIRELNNSISIYRTFCLAIVEYMSFIKTKTKIKTNSGLLCKS